MLTIKKTTLSIFYAVFLISTGVLAQDTYRTDAPPHLFKMTAGTQYSFDIILKPTKNGPFKINACKRGTTDLPGDSIRIYAILPDNNFISLDKSSMTRDSVTPFSTEIWLQHFSDTDLQIKDMKAWALRK